MNIRIQLVKSWLVCGIVWIFGVSVTSAVAMPPPSAYRRTVCSMANALDYLVGETLWTCKDRCERMSQCKAINYHLYRKLCVLQKTGETQTSDHSRCVSLEMNFLHSNIHGPCSGNPCGNLSICKSLNYELGYSCVPMFCSSPPRLEHASLMTDIPTPVGGSNVYQCDQGYTGFPNPRIRCLSNAEWASVNFVCYPNCPAIPSVAKADLLYWSPHRHFANTRAILKCKPGYYSLTDPVLVCDSNGTWSQFECLPYCVAPGPLTGGTITTFPAAPYVYESVVLFTCNSGYYHYPAENNTEMVCQTDGAWNYLAECYKHCGDPPPAIWHVNGLVRVSISTPSPFTVETVVKYKCVSLTHLSGSKRNKSTCNEEGIWAGPDYCCLKWFEYNPSKGKCTLGGQ